MAGVGTSWRSFLSVQHRTVVDMYGLATRIGEWAAWNSCYIVAVAKERAMVSRMPSFISWTVSTRPI